MATRAARFAHRSEGTLAQLFDFYGVDWQYEPRSFPIVWDGAGKVVESFTPDFYLPDFNLYLEITVISAKLQTRKNRKLRLLKASHPDVKIKLFMKRDMERLFSRLATRAA
ncbi:MAG: hypothetical protein ABI182_06265 [Candidatus Baltobacteraceae bacterium]